MEEPGRFSLDAAVSLAMRVSGQADPGQAVRFQAATGLAFASSDVLAVAPDGARLRMTTGLLGLTGPGGVLPRPYTEMVCDQQRGRSPALAAFLDLLAQNPLAKFAAAGIKYRPHRTAEAAAIAQRESAAESRGQAPQDGMRDALAALTGYADPGLAARLLPGLDPLLYYAGAFAARPRSADRLAAILSDWFGQTVQVEQFSGAWLPIEREERTRLPRRGEAGRFNRLGADAAAGARSWDLQGRVLLRAGPLALPTFRSLLPGQPMLRLLCALARLFLEETLEFRVNAVLAADAVPRLLLDPAAPPRLGWETWLPVRGRRAVDGTEPVFAPPPMETGCDALAGEPNP